MDPASFKLIIIKNFHSVVDLFITGETILELKVFCIDTEIRANPRKGFKHISLKLDD